MMLLCADKAVLIPDRVTIIGVTSKSYGFYYHNNNEKEGMKFHKESDYRNKAPLQIREKLCSVDEMDTAAAATYALLCERCGKEYEINIKNYYKAVIERELLSRSKDAVINIAAEEMKKNVSKMDYTELLEYIHGYFREERRTIDQRQLPWDNVTDLLNDISFVENTEKLEDIDLEYWLSHTNINICGHDKGVFIWGAYSRGKRIKDVLSSKGILVKGYIDNKDVKEYDGLPVFKLKNVNPNRYPIVLSMRFIYEDVIKELRDCGYGSEDGWVFKQILK